MEGDPFGISGHGLKFQVTGRVYFLGGGLDDRMRDLASLTDLDNPVIGGNIGMWFGQSSKLLVRSFCDA